MICSFVRTPNYGRQGNWLLVTRRHANRVSLFAPWQVSAHHAVGSVTGGLPRGRTICAEHG
jgi:hypothetical protein